MKPDWFNKRSKPAVADSDEYGAAQVRVAAMFCYLLGALTLAIGGALATAAGRDAPLFAGVLLGAAALMLATPFTDAFRRRSGFYGGAVIAAALLMSGGPMLVAGGAASLSALLLPAIVFAAAMVTPTMVSLAMAGAAIGAIGASLGLRLTGVIVPLVQQQTHHLILIAVTLGAACVIGWALAYLFRREMTRLIRDVATAHEAAEAASEAKSNFLARMSHEFRTPLNGVMGMNQLLQATPLNAQQQFYVETSIRSGETLLQIVDDVLDYSRMKAGDLTLENSPFDLENVIVTAAAIVSPEAVEKDLRFFVRLQPDLPRMLVGDGPRLRQALLNILGNAVKFTDEGHISLDVSGATLLDKRVALTIKVTDSGIGIAKEKRAAVFEMFSQANGGPDRQQTGAGLGLAIAQRLVSAMGGEISCQSRLGEGSVFAIELVAPMAGAAPARPGRAGGRIAIVSDHELSGAILEERLAHLGYEPELLLLSDLEFDGEPGSFGPCGATLLDISTRSQRNALRAEQVASAVRWIDAPVIAVGAIGEAAPTLQVEIAGSIATPIGSEALVAEIAEIASAGVEPRLGRTRAGERALSRCVLIAEDHDVNYLVVSEHLRQLGYTPERAHNGREAVAMHHRLRPAAILMDVAMPEMDGLEATRRIRAAEAESGAHTPIIGVTAHVFAGGDADACQDAGMDDYLPKPLQREDLAAKLERWAGPEDLRAQA